MHGETVKIARVKLTKFVTGILIASTSFSTANSCSSFKQHCPKYFC